MDSPRPSPLPRPILLRLSELRLPLDHSPAELEAAILRRLRLPPAALLAHRLVKRSVDARRPGSIQLVYSLDLELAVEGASVRQLRERLRRDPQLRPSPVWITAKRIKRIITVFIFSSVARPDQQRKLKDI